MTPGPAAIRGRRLVTARVAWLAASLLAVGIFVAGTLSYWTDLQQVCTLGAGPCSDRGLITPQNARELEELGLSVGFHAAFQVTITTFLAAVWLGVGAVIFWRRSDDRMALLVSLMLVTFGTAGLSTAPSDALAETHPALWFPVASVQFLGQVCMVLFFCLFPSGQFVPRWIRWLALAFLVSLAPSYFFPDSSLNPLNYSETLFSVVFLAFLAILVAAQIYRYWRVSGATERRQIKWVVFGTTAGIAGFVVSLLPYFFVPRLLTHISYLYFVMDAGLAISLTLIPLSIGAALALVYLSCEVVLQYAFRALTGQETQLAVVASTLAIAALFGPLRRQVQSFVDRRFYRRKYDAARTLEAFSARLRDEMDLTGLSENLIGVVRETMQPKHVSLWLRSPSEGAKR